MIKALIIDDSAYNRVTLSRMLAAHPLIEVVGTAVNGEDGIKQVLRLEPEVITLDLEMPVMDGFAFLRWLMAHRPTAVIAVSSKASDRSVFKALELGALDFVAKPGGRVSPRLTEIEKDLVEKVLQIRGLRIENLQRRVQEVAVAAPPVVQPRQSCEGGPELVAIGCSTGGPPALQQIFQSMPVLPLPFVVAQHMPRHFTRLFAERVNRLTRYEVKEAEEGERLKQGMVYVAPGGVQTEVVREGGGLRIGLREPEQSDLYAPSVDLLFESASETCGASLLAVVLTGMGDDGARGVRLVRERGGRTLAESAESAIIFGMPGEAIRTGCVDEVVPLAGIPEAIERLCAGKGE